MGNNNNVSIYCINFFFALYSFFFLKVKSELKNLVDNNNNARGSISEYQTLKLLGSGTSGVVHLVCCV